MSHQISRFAVGTLLALLAIAATRAEPATARASGTVIAEYSGTKTFTYVYDPASPAVWQESGTFTWDETITVRLGSGNGVVEGKPRLEISGRIVSTYAPPNTARSCTGNFSARTDVPQDMFPISFNVVGDTRSTHGTASAILPATGTYARSTSPRGTDCGIDPNGPAPTGELPPNGPISEVVTPLKDLKLGALPYTRNFKVFYRSPYKDEQTYVRSTFTVTGSGRNPPKQPETPARFRAKANAAQALKETWERSLYPCLASAAAPPLLALGPIGQASGTVILAVGGPLCLAYEKTMRDEINTINDPPLGSYERVAKVGRPRVPSLALPSCRRWTGSARKLCRSFETDAVALLRAAIETEALAAAIDTTISRETGALRVRNRSAISLQDRTLSGLDRRFLAARRAEARAGAAIRTLLAPRAIRPALSTSLCSGAIAKVSAALARRGIGQAKLAAVLGSQLDPHAIDWLNALASSG